MPKSTTPTTVIGEEALFEEYMLRRAARSRREVERQTIDAVALAVDAGVPWTRIGQILGMPAPVAEGRYGPAVERAKGA